MLRKHLRSKSFFDLFNIHTKSKEQGLSCPANSNFYSHFPHLSLSSPAYFSLILLSSPASSVMAATPSPELSNIRAQVEFYFGLENLMQDAFLLCRMNSRMMVPLSLIFSFKKIRQLSSSFDAVLAAVKQSPSKLVVEFDNEVWWIGPNPQARRELPCTIVLSDVPEEVTVENIEALTTVPLLHSFTFANGYWFATYQDRSATEMALEEMKQKTWGSVPVSACLRSELPVEFDPSAGHSQSQNGLKTDHHATRSNVANGSSRGLFQQPHAALNTRPASLVAGCPLFVSRNPMAAQRSHIGKGVSNALMSTFYSLPPAQQQMVMMNCMMAQQQMLAMRGHRIDETACSTAYAGPYVPANGKPFQRSSRAKRADSSARSHHIAPIGDGLDAARIVGRYSQTRPEKSPSSTTVRPVSTRMEALGADLPGIKPAEEAEGAAVYTSATEDATAPNGVSVPIAKSNARKSDRRVQNDSSQPLPSLDPVNYPTLGQEIVPVQKQPALSGWAAVIAKAPTPKVAKCDDTVTDSKPSKQSGSSVPQPSLQHNSKSDNSSANGTRSRTSLSKKLPVK